jgi:catalase
VENDMTAPVAGEIEMTTAVERKKPAYDPNNLSPEDEEARKYDDTSDGIDWDEIIASTQDDFEAGRYSFNSADYATQEEAFAAMDELLNSILQEVLRERDSVPALDATNPK